MKADELREKYLTFFESKGHARRPSDVLVPTWDPSVKMGLDYILSNVEPATQTIYSISQMYETAMALSVAVIQRSSYR